jgi:hypothetical protein
MLMEGDVENMIKLNSYEMEIRFTEIYKKHMDKYPGLREVMCAKEMF